MTVQQTKTAEEEQIFKALNLFWHSWHVYTRCGRLSRISHFSLRFYPCQTKAALLTQKGKLYATFLCVTGLDSGGEVTKANSTLITLFRWRFNRFHRMVLAATVGLWVNGSVSPPWLSLKHEAFWTNSRKCNAHFKHTTKKKNASIMCVASRIASCAVIYQCFGWLAVIHVYAFSYSSALRLSQF